MNVTHVRRQNFYALPSRQRALLSEPSISMLETFSRVDDAISGNAELAEAILENGISSLGLAKTSATHAQTNPWEGTSTKTNLDKARSTIHQMYRDWSTEGEVERAACYGPIMQDLAERFPPAVLESEASIKVLVPGAGLGRLVYELCRLGFDVEGNEISYHQLLASSFILNHTNGVEEWPLYPWAFSFSNNMTREDQLRKIMIPDVHPRSLISSGSMNMTTGDFCVVYRNEEYENSFDAVATVFFIDTAPNLINYIETVRHCLKPGGIWANLGPLLWHSSDNKTSQADKDLGNGSDAVQESSLGIGEPGSFELTEDEVLILVQKMGFKISKHETDVGEVGYVSNPKSMLRSVYHPAHWVATKL